MAYKLLEAGVAIYAVGVGSFFAEYPNYLEQITYDPDRVYNVSDFAQLTEDLVNQILNDTCCPLNFTRPSPPPPRQFCDTIDLIFVLDESESVNQQDPTNFDALKAFLVNLTETFTIDQQYTRVSVVGYGRTANVSIHFYDKFDYNELRNRIAALPYLGGARNVAAGLEAARKEILDNSRQSQGESVPIYLVHVGEYGHDVGSDPKLIAQDLGSAFGVIIFNAAVTKFQWDEYYQNETAAIVAGGALGSKQFNVTLYQELVHSEIRQTFLDIFDQQFICTTTPAAVTAPMHLQNEDDKEK